MMNWLTTVFVLGCVLLYSSAAPVADNDEIVIDKEFFDDKYKIYTSDHVITNIIVPSNKINDDANTRAITLMLVQADIEDGKLVEKGMFVLKNGTIAKILDSGRDAASGDEETKNMYIAAKDGLHIYNGDDGTVKKYGHFDVPSKGIAKQQGKDLLYVLTDTGFVYKVTEQGNKKNKIESISNAQEIALDNTETLYFYDKNNKVYILNENEGVKEVQGIPAAKSYLKLVRSPIFFNDRCIVIVDNAVYVANNKGESEKIDIKVGTKPTAYAIDIGIVHYYAYDKNIYEYNFLSIILEDLVSGFREFVQPFISIMRDMPKKELDDLFQVE